MSSRCFICFLLFAMSVCTLLAMVFAVVFALLTLQILESAHRYTSQGRCISVCPLRGPGSTHAWPGSFRRRAGIAPAPLPILPPGSVRDAIRPAPHSCLCCRSSPPLTLPGLWKTARPETRGGALLPPAPPASGVPPDTPRREGLPCTQPNRRGWLPLTPFTERMLQN